MGPTTDEEMTDPYDNTEKRARDTAKALKLRRRGKTYAQIADVLNISDGLVSELLREAAKRIADVAVEEHYAIETTRLAYLTEKIEAVLDEAGGDDELMLKAVDRALRVHEATVKLTGIAAPDKSEVTVNEVKVSSTLTDKLSKVTADLDKKRSARRTRKREAGE